MPRYFFNVYDDLITKDEEGVELPDEEAAKREAVEGARDLIAEQVKQGYFVRSHRIDVSGKDREKVLSVNFGDVVEIKD